MWLACAACIFVASQVLAAWKNTIVFPDEPYAHPSTGNLPGWVKFTILTSDPNVVYFQDSAVYPFHYDFAVAELEPFAGMSPSEFDAVTLYLDGQMAILGAVILPPPLTPYGDPPPEYGIEIVGRDPYPRETVRDVFQLVESKVIGTAQAFYFPTFEQRESAEQHRDYLEAHGIIISSADRWARDNTCYSTGWTIGELNFFPGDQIDAAYLSGALRPDDILLTDAVPSEIPFLAGVLTLSASTPNSHVAILAQTFGIPFVHLVLDEDAQHAQSLVGRKVALRARHTCRVRLVDVEDELDQATIDEVMMLKAPPPLDIQAKQVLGAYSANVDGLQLSDIRFFGGKAANFSVVRGAVPANSPVATAFSFDLWDGFMDQEMTGGNTLRQEITQMLVPFDTYPPPNMSALADVLDDIRDMIKDDTVFDSALQAAVIDTLQDPQYGFAPELKIRFRSSTNVEDSDQFTGAGLYDSYSGCLADDLDGDSSGPSICDADQDNERGVFRAIRKVFASFYNNNAFLERLKYGIDENDVGMALLVHHSFPDPIELANGVGTLRHTWSGHTYVYLVSQTGAHSVTNPEPGAISEEVDVDISVGGVITPEVVRYSNLVQLGATVMDFPDEYIDLTGLLILVADVYEAASGLTSYKLEYEYKKTAPNDDLVITQVRRIPWQSSYTTPFLINDPQEFCTFQGEWGDVYANHRLKTRLSLNTRNMWLTEENLQNGFYGEASLRYAAGCLVQTQDGDMMTWPSATHSFADGTSTHGWVFDHLENVRTYALTTGEPWPSSLEIPTEASTGETPLVFLGDFDMLKLEADYASPVVAGTGSSSSDSVRLVDCSKYDQGPWRQRYVSQGGQSITTQFYFPPPPLGGTAGYTAPLQSFSQTLITNMTTDQILLDEEFSQTYRPEHHNFEENFVFEPALDPHTTLQQLDELTAAGIRAIYMYTTSSTEGFFVTFGELEWGDTCEPCSDADEDNHCKQAPDLDCDDTNPDVWATPGEVSDLIFFDWTNLGWSQPAEIGGTSVAYDTLRSRHSDDFVATLRCIESDDGTDLTATDAAFPFPGNLFYYLVRAVNDCPDGDGPLGQASSGAPRVAADCP
jgi:hypothetical protein